MAGLSRDYDATEVELGPGDLWFAAELPATGSRPVIGTASDGALTPDATASAGAIHAGLTLEGTRVTYKPTVEEFTANETTAPIITAITGEALSISGSMIQILDFVKLSKLIAGGTYSTGSGYSQITIGGKQTLSTFTALLIAPLYNDPTKILGVELYKSYAPDGLEFDISRTKLAATPFSLMGQAITSRPQGDQIGLIWKTQ
jgi:hypothetical protein